MRTTILSIFLLVIAAVHGQTTEYSGVVKIKGENGPLPGVTVLLKGTKIGTQTDFDGNFTINVPDSIQVLSFLYVGFKPLEYRLNEETFLEILMKEDCTICFLDAQQIGLYVQSGILNGPVGGQFDFTFPSFWGTPTLKSGIGYQTNFHDNRLLNAYVNLEHLFVDCGFNMDINATLRDLDFDQTIESKAHSIEATLHTRGLMTHVGYSNIRYLKDDTLIHSNGPLLGVGTWLGPPFYATVSAKSSIYNSVSEYQGEIRRSFKRISTFLRYYKVGNYNEVTLGMGINFTYYLRKRQE